MKKIYFKLVFVLTLALSFGSCEDYLNIPSEVSIQEKDVFGTYNTFQGYVDQIYTMVSCHVRSQLTSDGCYGGETISLSASVTGYKAVRGDYVRLQDRGYYQTYGKIGVWDLGWSAIRKVNIALKNIDLLVATQEQKDLIKGQLLFFRAFFHTEILNAWGPIPYLRNPLGDDLNQARFYEYKGKKNFQAATEYAVEDLTEAAALLPVAWPDPTTQLGRATRLAALSYKAHALLFAGSPLMNEVSGGAAEVNKEYMTRAAVAANEAIKLAEDNPTIYGLVMPTDALKNFATTTREVPWTKETIWAQYNNIINNQIFLSRIGRVFAPNSAVFGGNNNMDTPTQNYIDLFEMADGSLYNPAIHDADNAKRWNSRDPRFRANVYVDRDIPVTGKPLSMYKGGPTIITDNQQTPYVIRKYWPFGVDGKAGGPLLNNLSVIVPLMRLAEVYLIYAEAANWAYADGNDGNATATGDNHTALSAVNKVRSRSGQVPTTATGGAHGNFHKMLMNERAVEFCFEAGQYWHDIRRYKTGESFHNTAIFTLDFDKTWTPTSFARRELLKRTFEKKHYWMPFPRDLTLMYKEFPQNEGWN